MELPPSIHLRKATYLRGILVFETLCFYGDSLVVVNSLAKKFLPPSSIVAITFGIISLSHEFHHFGSLILVGMVIK